MEFILFLRRTAGLLTRLAPILPGFGGSAKKRAARYR